VNDDLSGRYLVNSIVRACTILRALGRDGGGLRIGQIAREVGIDRTTAYRIVLTLEHCGFMERRSGTKRYKLGVGAYEVGTAYLRGTDLHSVARPIMIELAARVQEAAHWAILSGDKAVCIDKIDSPRGLGTTSKIGRAVPLNSGSVGKVLLAYQPAEVRERLLESVSFSSFTDRTISTVADMREEIAAIRARGFCVSLGEGEEDMACIAAPIFDHTSRIIAGLSVGGPIHRFADPETEQFIVRELVKATRTISEKMGCPAFPPEEGALDGAPATTTSKHRGGQA
jgi:DNA-binding IclR family transcriptional regulator